jgi:Phage tail sheath C-terminal domain
MALVSPGVSISVNDQSQYVNSNVGSVPLVILATAENKTYSGSAATGTSAAMAGQLQSFTSQRDLVTAMGTPTFQLSASGTPINGSEINEYGLLAAYSALGISNQLYAIRADIDLNQLIGTSTRPTGAEANGTNWLNIASTEFGIYSLNSSTSSFSSIDSNLLLITSSSQVFNDSGFAYAVPTPLNSIGQQGSYALVFTNTDGSTPSVIRLFYKATSLNYGNLTNSWVQVGSSNWQNSTPTVQGTTGNPSNILGSSTFTINTVTVTTGSGVTTVAGIASAINSASITGVKATVSTNGLLTIFATSSATSNGSVADGKVIITDGTNTPMSKCGVTAGSYYCPYFFYGTYSQTPSGGWFSTDTQPRPSGSIWWKTTSTGTGWNPVLNQYNASLETWTAQTVPLYTDRSAAIYGLDPVGGGQNIVAGQIIAIDVVQDTTSNSLQFLESIGGTEMTATGNTPSSFTAGNTYTMKVSAPGVSTLASYSITTSGTSATSFVSDILNANIPYVTAQVNSSGTISIIHTAGGYISITQTSGTPLTNAGFVNQSSQTVSVIETGTIILSNWYSITSSIVYSATTPYANPTSGTLWYYSNPADVDIMINNNGWKAYRTVTSDVRGYNLSLTDANGVIVSPSQPTSQSSGGSLAAGDIWLNSADLISYPSLSRWNGSAWVAIDNTDHVSNNAIIFADARWDTTGTVDPVSGALPPITTLLNTTYLDQDAPDYRLYPRGTLLFNTRRSGFNVKKFVSNYYNSTSFPNPGTIPGTSGSLPTETNAWVSVSGNNELGVMNAGSAAQRALVVEAMQSAVNSNTDVLDANYNFNLIVAPNYPELIPSLVTLNDNRGDTAFIIGDTPMTLQPTATELANWSNNIGDYAGTGLATASPYLAVYYPAGLTTDLAGNSVVVPASHAVLRTYLYNDQVAYPWFAPAGVNRGLVSNLNDIGYINATTGAFVHNGINQGLRDSLYTLNINPITQLPGTGLVVWGQETRSGDTSSRNRVNVVRLENYLRVIFASVSNGYLFEPNDTITRKSIATQVESALSNVLALRGLYDFLVICDTSNNTASTIANNQLYVDVAIEPMKDVEFIYIPIAIYNPGTIATLNASST